MTHFQVIRITQWALGEMLEFSPPMGTAELDNLIDQYVSGNQPIVQKRAQLSLGFLDAITPSTKHPVSRVYHVSLPSTPMTQFQVPVPVPSQMASPPQENLPSISAVSHTPSRPSGSRKRSLPESDITQPSAPSAKRPPGFSIITRDGVDITDHSSRGPKTKEQRDHAALIRRLKACNTCRKSKQKCDPSHHRPIESVGSSPASSTPSPAAPISSAPSSSAPSSSAPGSSALGSSAPSSSASSTSAPRSSTPPRQSAQRKSAGGSNIPGSPQIPLQKSFAQSLDRKRDASPAKAWSHFLDTCLAVYSLEWPSQKRSKSDMRLGIWRSGKEQRDHGGGGKWYRLGRLTINGAARLGAPEMSVECAFVVKKGLIPKSRDGGFDEIRRLACGHISGWIEGYKPLLAHGREISNLFFDFVIDTIRSYQN